MNIRERKGWFGSSVAVGAFAAFSLSSLITPASAQKSEAEVKVPILACPTGCGVTQAFQIAQERARQWHPWLRPIAVDTGGYAYNLKYVAKSPHLWKTNVFGAGSLILSAADIPLKPYFDEKIPKDDFKILAVTAKSANIFLTLDPSIKTPADFKNKRVALGTLAQNEYGMHGTMVIDALGLRSALKTLDHLGQMPAMDALLNGNSDVGNVWLGFDNEANTLALDPSLRHVQASGRKFYYVSVTPDMVDRVNKALGVSFIKWRFKANTLPSQPEPLDTYGNIHLLAVHKSFPENVAYELAKFLVENSPKLAQYHSLPKVWTPETLSYGAKENPGSFHPGALRAYKELGVVK
jgi:TRAP-type uncharacterized transport system substrate-binding protein